MVKIDYLIAKIYEILIKRKLKNYDEVKFEYSVLIERGFTEKYIKPNTLNRVTIYYKSNDGYWSKKGKMTFKNIKEANKNKKWRYNYE